MSRLSSLLLPLLPLVSIAGSQAVGAELSQQDGQWFESDAAGRRFAVNPHVISVRWKAPIQDLAQLVARLRSDANSLADSVETLSVLRTNRLGIADLQLTEGQDPVELARALAATGLLEFATTNTFGEWVNHPNDSSYGTQWALNNTGQSGGTPGADIGAEAAWDIQTGDASVIIAVLDSGTDVFHPDLVANRYENPGDPINGLDDDNNGFVDDYYGWDFGSGNNDVTSNSYHGTFVAGVLGARTDNALGMAGVAGGFGAQNGCTYIPCPVGESFPDGAVLDDAIIYAADQGALVITMSLTVGASAAIDAAVDYAVNVKGVFINCAAGNSGGTNSVGYPATLADVVAVASSNRFDAVSGFSSGGPQVWISAPGEDIYSTTLGNSYTTSSGTSFSSPHIAAIAGLMRSANSLLTPADIADILKDTAVDIGAPGYDVRAGWGRVDAAAAISQAAGGCGIGQFCTSTPNSIGAAAFIYSAGSPSISNNDLTLQADFCPTGQNGIFFYGPGEQQVPFGNGFLCVTGPQQRLPIVNTGIFGIASYVLDNTAPPQASGQITAGSSWSFQFWFRDPFGGGAGFNTSDGLTVSFCP